MKEILFFQVIFENFLRSDYVIISGCNKSQKYEIYLHLHICYPFIILYIIVTYKENLLCFTVSRNVNYRNTTKRFVVKSLSIICHC